MIIICAHDPEYSFNYNPFGKNKEPTDKQINKYRLYKCSACNRWYSLIGITSGE